MSATVSSEYFNTTDVHGSELIDFCNKAHGQAARILAFFEQSPRLGYTPSVVRRLVFADSVPITSVRRAMTTLTNAGELKKTDRQRQGPYDHPEHVWQLAERPPEQRELL